MSHNYARESLRDWIASVSPGGCKILSRGADCECPLCLIDNALTAERAARVEAERQLAVVTRTRDLYGRELNEWQEKEASCCPEDASFVDVIAYLRRTLVEAERQRDEAAAELAREREARAREAAERDRVTKLWHQFRGWLDFHHPRMDQADVIGKVDELKAPSPFDPPFSAVAPAKGAAHD